MPIFEYKYSHNDPQDKKVIAKFEGDIEAVDETDAKNKIMEHLRNEDGVVKKTINIKIGKVKEQ